MMQLFNFNTFFPASYLYIMDDHTLPMFDARLSCRVLP